MAQDGAGEEGRALPAAPGGFTCGRCGMQPSSPPFGRFTAAIWKLKAGNSFLHAAGDADWGQHRSCPILPVTASSDGHRSPRIHLTSLSASPEHLPATLCAGQAPEYHPPKAPEEKVQQPCLLLPKHRRLTARTPQDCVFLVIVSSRCLDEVSGPWLCSELCLEGAAKVVLLPALLQEHHVPKTMSPSREAVPVPLLILGTELAPEP